MKKKSLLIIGLLVAMSLASVANAQLPIVEPEEVGFASERLSRIQDHFATRVDNGEIAGIVTLVARHGRIAHFSALGYANAEQELPMERDTIFRIYSMTKPIASTALMMLYEDGLFQMTDPLSRFIPEFANLRVLRTPTSPLDETVALEREPTVQDVLRHTAGLSHGLGVSEYDRHFVETGIFGTETSLEEMMTALSTIPLVNQPGEMYRYSVGPDVALRLVEVIAGMPADDYLEQRMFGPLGMDDTGYWVDADGADRLAPVHWLKDGELVSLDDEYGHPQGGVLVQPWSVNSYTFDHEFKGGSFGLLSTAEDYWRFAQAMLNGGALDGERIIASRVVDYMRRNHLTDQQRATLSVLGAQGFGLGFGIIEDPAAVGYVSSEGTFYWGGAAATTFWIDPVEEIVVVAMTQHMGVRATGSIRGELAALVYGALED